jgi:hypothetical protein
MKLSDIDSVNSRGTVLSNISTAFYAFSGEENSMKAKPFPTLLSLNLGMLICLIRPALLNTCAS